MSGESDPAGGCPRREELVEVLRGGERAEAIRAHVHGCEPCQEELAALESVHAALGTLPLPVARPEALARTAEAVRNAPWPVPRSWGRVAAVAFGSAAAVGGAIYASGLRPDRVLLRPATRFVEPALLAAAFVIGMIAVAGKRSSQWLFVAGAAAVAAAVTATEPGVNLVSVEGGLHCVPFGLAVALAPLVLGTVLFSSSIRSRLGGIALGAAAGMVGMAALHLHCPAGRPIHGAIHASVLVLSAALGYLLSAILAPSSAPAPAEATAQEPAGRSRRPKPRKQADEGAGFGLDLGLLSAAGSEPDPSKKHEPKPGEPGTNGEKNGRRR